MEKNDDVGQLHSSVSVGSGQEGRAVKKKLEEAASSLGYTTSKRGRGVGTMIREMALWVIAHGIWRRGEGMIDLKGGDDVKPAE